MRRGFCDGPLLASLLRCQLAAGPWSQQDIIGCEIAARGEKSSILCAYHDDMLVIEAVPDLHK